MKEAVFNNHTVEMAKLAVNASMGRKRDTAKCQAKGLKALTGCEEVKQKEASQKAKEKMQKLAKAKLESEKAEKLAKAEREQEAYASAAAAKKAEAQVAYGSAKVAYASAVAASYASASAVDGKHEVSSYGETQSKCLKLTAMDCVTTLGCHLDSSTNNCLEGTGIAITAPYSSSALPYVSGQVGEAEEGEESLLEEEESLLEPLSWQEHMTSDLGSDEAKKQIADQQKQVAGVQKYLTKNQFDAAKSKASHTSHMQVAKAFNKDVDRIKNDLKGDNKVLVDVDEVLKALKKNINGTTATCTQVRDQVTSECERKTAVARIKTETAAVNRARITAKINTDDAKSSKAAEASWTEDAKGNQKRVASAVKKAEEEVVKVIRKDNVTMDPGPVGYITRPDLQSGTLSEYADVESTDEDPACKAPKHKAYEQCQAWLDAAYDECRADYTTMVGDATAALASKDAAVAKVAKKITEDRVEKALASVAPAGSGSALPNTPGLMLD